MRRLTFLLLVTALVWFGCGGGETAAPSTLTGLSGSYDSATFLTDARGELVAVLSRRTFSQDGSVVSGGSVAYVGEIPGLHSVSNLEPPAPIPWMGEEGSSSWAPAPSRASWPRTDCAIGAPSRAPGAPESSRPS